MSLIRTIQAEAIESTANVASLLRKCKLLAARLDHAQLAQWVELELGGYPREQEVPSYRRVGAASYGNFVGPFGARATHIQIPLTVLPAEYRDQYRVARLDQPVSA